MFLKQEDIRIIIINEFFDSFTTLAEAVRIERNNVELSVDNNRIRHLSWKKRLADRLTLDCGRS